MLSGRGEIAIALGKAAALHAPFPADVPDTPHNRALWSQIQAEAEVIEATGGTVDVPAD